MSVLCRDKEQTELSNLVIGDEFKFPSSIFLHGPSGSGKGTLIQSLYQISKITIRQTSLVTTSYSSKLIFSDLLDNKSSKAPDNFEGFLEALRLQKHLKTRILLILRNSERFTQFPLLLSAFSRLQDLCQMNVCVLFVSEISWNKLRPGIGGGGGLNDPIVVLCSAYSKSELTTILASLLSKTLSLEENSDYSFDFFHSYASILVGTFFTSCRTISEYIRIAESNFLLYTEPIRTGEISSNNVRALYRNIEGTLKSSLATILLREYTVSYGDRAHVELPFFSKFLLIASYLASHNPPKSDKRFFVKHHGKQRKTKAIIKAQQKYSTQLVGPKSFPLDRVLAIFYAIIDDRATPSANILSQLSSLITLRYIIKNGSSLNEDLDAPKYKCVVGLDFIRKIAKTLNFEVTKYMYDHV